MFLIIGSLQLSASVYSQNGKMNVQVSEMKLADLLWELQESSEFVFVYRTDDIQGIGNISLDLENTSIEDILDEVLSDTHLEYKLDNNVVVIKKKELQPIVVETDSVQEKKELKGTVTDEDGNTLPGVSVVVKGTTNGTATDIDGNYTINFDEGKFVLVYSFVGMVSQEIAYNGQSVLNVTLAMDAEVMDEVVVTGYSTISRERATGSYSKIASEDLEIRPSESIGEVIGSSVAGVQQGEKEELLSEVLDLLRQKQLLLSLLMVLQF